MPTLPLRNALFLLSLFIPLVGLGQAAQRGLVTLVNVRGQVTVISAEGAVIENVSSGMQVTDGAQITTGRDGGLILVFSTGTTLSVSPGTELTLDTYHHEPGRGSDSEAFESGGDSTTQISIGYGEIIGRVKKLRPKSQFEVETPIGIAGVRGTDIIINVTRQQDQWVVTFGVEDGRLQIFTIAGSPAAPDIGGLEAGESLRLSGQVDDSGNVTILDVEQLQMTPEQIRALSDAISEQTNSSEVQDLQGNPDLQPDPETEQPEEENAPIQPVSIPGDYQVDPYTKAGNSR